MKVHEVAVRGYEVGGEDYERSRPGYPSDALDLLATELGLCPGRTVLELGAGTGKLTRLLRRTGARIVASEPVAAMLERLVAAVPEVPVLTAAAEAVPLVDASVDAVVVATAFHWFQGESALAEISRVLEPGGGLGLLWNNPDRQTPWVAQVWEVVDAQRGGVPGNRDRRWQEAFERSTGFTALEHAQFAHGDELDEDGLLARVASISFIAALTPEARADVLDEVGRIVARHRALSGGRRFTLPYVTSVHWCRRR